MIQQTLFDVPENRFSTKKRSTAALYEAIHSEYKKLKNKKKYGVPVYSQNYIFHELAHKFYRSPRTIENIVFGRV